MATLLLIIIYMAFISLGLPDSLIGVSWPAIREEFSLGLEYGGIISLVITLGTISSSLLSGYVIARFKTYKVIVFSVLLTLIALVGYAMSEHFVFFVLFSIPMGFGAGSIDTALNHYVAVNYKPHHMNWLHSFWGVGATAGPVIMAYYLLDEGWRSGFMSIAILQFIFLVILTLSLPLWKEKESEKKEERRQHFKLKNIKGVLFALLIFMLYVSLELSIGVWGSSYLVIDRSFNVSDAANIIALYYGGITLGRFLSGLASFKLSNRTLINFGIVLIFLGTFTLAVLKSPPIMTASFVVIGLGLSPIFPSMVHDTPAHFGEEKAQYVIGYQIASAYIGGAIFPPLFGLLFGAISITLFPYLMFILTVCLVISLLALRITIAKKA